MKIVIASNNGVSLSAQHFGDSDKFYFYKILNNNTLELEKVVENKFKNVDESTAHGSKAKRQSIVSYLGDDVDFIVSNKMSPNFKKINENTKVCPIISEIEEIEDIQLYLNTIVDRLDEIKSAKSVNKKTPILTIKKVSNRIKKYDLLVIGGGPAAITIAKIIQDKMSVGIIRPEDHSMIYCAMPYAIEKLLPVEKTLKSDSIVTDENVDLIRDKAIKVDFEKKTVSTENNGEISYKKLIIATGANPILPPIEGSNLKNVMTFKTEEDLRKIIKIVDNGLKKVVVIGAGAIGIELAQALNERKVETHLVDMSDQVLPNLVDYGMVERAQQSLVSSGVKIHLKSRVNALVGNEKVEEIILENRQKIIFGTFDDCTDNSQNLDNYGLVVFAAGMRPNVEIFKDTKLKIEKDGIVINGKMETNIKDVYAIGDCCQFKSAISGETLSGKLATNAVPMGRVLATNLLGGEREYPGFYNGAATKINEFYIGGTGFTEIFAKKYFDVEVGYAQMTTIFPVMPGAKKVRMKLVVDKKSHKLVGGQVVSGEPVTDKVDQLTMAIQFGITVDQLADFSYSSQPYQSFFPANNLIVKAAEAVMKKL